MHLSIVVIRHFVIDNNLQIVFNCCYYTGRDTLSDLLECDSNVFRDPARGTFVNSI